MNAIVITKNYGEPPFCEKEILRYAGCKSSDEELLQLLHSCIDEVREKLVYKVCYRQLPVSIMEDVCDFGCFQVQSKSLAQNLRECQDVVLFGATIGVEIDRQILKYGRISPSKALMLQAIGTERIEALCDLFCKEMAEVGENGVNPRFSPGYGDVPLTVQKEFFAVLDCAKRIGVSLNDSLLMSPSKSVTAFLGIRNRQNSVTSPTEKNKCITCTKTDCAYRGVL